MVLKKWRITGTSDTRGEERVKVFGAVVDVLITASGENFKASEIVYFSNCNNFAAEVMVKKIVFKSAVDSEHDRVWRVVFIISIGDSEVNAITRLVRAVTLEKATLRLEKVTLRQKEVPLLRQINTEDSCRSLFLECLE
jgi:predicted transcriptional regulator